MLRIFRSAKGLDFPALMCVYSEANSENGEREYPHEPPGLRQLLAEEDFREYIYGSFFPTEGAFYAIWEVEGEYVAALRAEPHRDGMIIAGLESAPCHRRKGYATRLLTETAKLLKGKKIYSHVDKTNAASLRVHEKCGFRIAQHRAVSLDGSVLPGSYTLVLEA